MTRVANAGAQSAIRSWAERVRREHEQADRVRSDEPQTDHWKKLAHRFAPASRDKALRDETFIAVSKYVRKSDTVLDVGAGAGRLAVPLAEQCAHVTAVEPSETMQAQLGEQVSAWGLENLTVVGSKWEEVNVDSADVVICAHVVYTVEQIEEFLKKLATSSKRDVLVIVFEDPAMANYFPLWKLVYGEERISLPSLPELKDVLSEMHIEYVDEPLPAWRPRPFADLESAYQESLARLFIADETTDCQLTQKLRTALEESLVPAEDGLLFNWARPHRPWLVRWSV